MSELCKNLRFKTNCNISQHVLFSSGSIEREYILANNNGKFRSINIKILSLALERYYQILVCSRKNICDDQTIFFGLLLLLPCQKSSCKGNNDGECKVSAVVNYSFMPDFMREEACLRFMLQSSASPCAFIAKCTYWM